MSLYLVKCSKTTVSTWVQLCISVSTNMTLQFNVCLSFPPSGHWYGILLLCTQRLWRCKLLDWLKHLLHSEHLYGFSPLWILLCLPRCPARVNRLLQTVHSNGFSPERQVSNFNEVPSLCDFSRCTWSWIGLLKESEQCPHEYGFASVWIRTWYFSSMFVLNCFLQ